MINIFQNSKVSDQTLFDLLDSYSLFLKKNLHTDKYSKANYSIEKKLKKINLNIKSLATAKFEELLKIEADFNKANIKSPLTKDEENYFCYLYKQARQSFLNEVADKLSIKSCPFCNMQEIITFYDNSRNRNIIEAQFDHFYPKSIHPLLTICFFNIIPICSYCNNRKGTQYIDYSPYINDKALYTDNLLKFTYTYDHNEELKINLESLNPIIDTNVDVLSLKDKYNSNNAKNQVKKALSAYQKYNNKKIKSLETLLSTNFSRDEINKILLIIENSYKSDAFIRYDFNEQNYSEYSYSKLWHDIGVQIIKIQD